MVYENHMKEYVFQCLSADLFEIYRIAENSESAYLNYF